MKDAMRPASLGARISAPWWPRSRSATFLFLYRETRTAFIRVTARRAGYGLMIGKLAHARRHLYLTARRVRKGIT